MFPKPLVSHAILALALSVFSRSVIAVAAVPSNIFPASEDLAHGPESGLNLPDLDNNRGSGSDTTSGRTDHLTFVRSFPVTPVFWSNPIVAHEPAIQEKTQRRREPSPETTVMPPI